VPDEGGPTTLEQLPGWAARLLAGARVAHLGLLDEHDHPRVLPVTFVVYDDALWTAVDRKPKRDPGREPARVGYLRRDPRAALTVDRYDSDWNRLAWVQVLGEVAIFDAGEAPDAITALGAKYPQYAAEPAPGPLLRLDPRRTLCWAAAPG
jgi:PPOX class probable F420-dependent enzyme